MIVDAEEETTAALEAVGVTVVFDMEEEEVVVVLLFDVVAVVVSVVVVAFLKAMETQVFVQSEIGCCIRK